MAKNGCPDRHGTRATGQAEVNGLSAPHGPPRSRREDGWNAARTGDVHRQNMDFSWDETDETP